MATRKSLLDGAVMDEHCMICGVAFEPADKISRAVDAERNFWWVHFACLESAEEVDASDPSIADEVATMRAFRDEFERTLKKPH